MSLPEILSNSCRSLLSFSQLELRPSYWVSYCNFLYLKCTQKIAKALVCCSLNWNNWHERFLGPAIQPASQPASSFVVSCFTRRLQAHTSENVLLGRLSFVDCQRVPSSQFPVLNPQSALIGWVAPRKLQQFILHYSAWMAFSLHERAAKKEEGRAQQEKSKKKKARVAPTKTKWISLWPRRVYHPSPGYGQFELWKSRRKESASAVTLQWILLPFHWSVNDSSCCHSL